MSDNRSSRSPSQSRNAEGFIRAILDDRPPTANISPTGELYRAVERFHRNIDRVLAAAQAQNARNTAFFDSMSSGSDRELRRRFNRDPEPSNESGRSGNLNPTSLPPLRSLHRMGIGLTPTSRSSRYREQRERNVERHRSMLENMNASSSFDDFTRNTDETNGHLRALLEFTTNNPILPQPSNLPSLTTSDTAEESRRFKRRKLDSDKMVSNFKHVRYGMYGQVEPGELTMEIVSCDGGTYSVPDGSKYMAENILKNDTSVYCTKSTRCNIILRHHGGTVFSLKELVIKAPGSNRYTSPVQEGMVFVAMSQDDIFTRTAQYQIQYQSSRATQPGGLTTIQNVRYDDDGQRTESTQRIRHRAYDDDDDDVVLQTAQIPYEFTVPAPPLNVTTECSEDHSGDEGYHNNYFRSRQPPDRIGPLPFERGLLGDNDGDESDDGLGFEGPSDWSSLDDSTLYPPIRRRRRESMTLDEAREANQIATQEAVRAVGGGLMAPLARFNIEKGKNKCTIRFDPPVSARFLLLKMWSPNHDTGKNIDIQAVIAKGFAGPRYVPSVELR